MLSKIVRSVLCVGVLAGGALALQKGAQAATGPSAQAVAISPNSKAQVSGNLKTGKVIDLAWATKSSVACFPSVKNDHFDGHHLLYTLDLPAQSVLKIELVPQDKKSDLSLYAYSVGTTNTQLPPSISSVVSCEASYGSKSISKPYNPGSKEAVELNATTNPYRVVVGVAGAQKLKKGDFTLNFDLQTAAAPKTGAITSATPVGITSNGTKSLTGKIDPGTEIDLAWAANSSVACFPATRNQHFDGNHVAFSFSLPRYTNATVELIPKASNLDLSLYAYTMGTTRNDLPPNVSSVVTCEASYGSTSISQPYNPGATESIQLTAINNPYNAIIGVAGAQGLKKGDFTLKVTLAPR
jgi:hypothetical protein